MFKKILIIILLTIILVPTLGNGWSYKWTGKGKLYDQPNQYFVTCRLKKEKNLYLGEDGVKCFYTCSDKDSMVITTHSDFACEKQIKSPRGDYRDWRGR